MVCFATTDDVKFSCFRSVPDNSSAKNNKHFFKEFVCNFLPGRVVKLFSCIITK